MGRREAAGYYLVMNPGSRGGRSAGLFREIHSELDRRGLDWDCGETRNLEEAESLARAAAEAGWGAVVAVGGDGTINRVINGLYRPGGEPVSPARLGVIYTGTSPDFCRSHALPVRDVPRAAAVLAGGRTKRIDIGRVRYGDGSLRHFACCANIGIGPALARAANSGIRGRVGDAAGTFLALVATLLRYRRVCLTVDGAPVPGVYNLSVGKTYYVASGLKIHSALGPCDGRLYRMTVDCRPLRAVLRLYRGAPLPLEYVTEVAVAGDAEVEFDGDACGRLPVTISLATPLELLAP